MKTIKETLDELTPEQKRQLMFAFEHSIPQHVVLPDGRFIGVHVGTIKGLTVDDCTGNGWAIGKTDAPSSSEQTEIGAGI